ncbi:MAG: non-ribosomal peptide synthetase, partial [Candidatus Electrothrix sp. AR1]|nr:non-ribosomal peptide synthetase [Candidatus Electrothrix sp. AR1]
EKLPFRENEVCCLKTSINFVDHVAEIFAPLLQGIPLVVVPEDLRTDAIGLMNLMAERKVTRIVLVPSLLKAMLDAQQDLDQFQKLKYVFCSGESLPLSLAEEFHQKISSAGLFNLYGSSEVAADVTCFEVRAEDIQEKNPKNETVPIGKPISNTEIYILDQHGGLMPSGRVGELYVGGAGLAQGYLNRPEFTEEKFIRNPFAEHLGGGTEQAAASRMFRTGDLARWLPDGNLEFHGRRDHQVKLRGFRIELGEIEEVLEQHEGVREAVVTVADREGNQFLAAYITEAQNTHVEISALRTWLRKQLPYYMIPASYTLLDSLPLTPNGKTDRHALPAPGLVSSEEKKYTAPRTLFEQQLAAIWAKFLKIEIVGVHDNFFDLGGNSLLAVGMLSEIGKKFDRQLPVPFLLKAPTVAQLAEMFTKDGWTPPGTALVPVQVGGSKPPFFFIPQGGSTALSAIPYTRYLGVDQFQKLKYVFCSGESLPLSLAEEFHQKISSAGLFNLYGSSEV